MFVRKFRPTFECLEGRDCPAPLTSVIDSLGNLRIMGDVDNLNGGLQVIATGANTLDVINGITPFLTGVTYSGNLILQTGAAADTIFIDLSGGSLTGGI